MVNLLNHINLGDIQQHGYLSGVIKEVYPESEDISEELWDTVDVYIEHHDITINNAPCFYHCRSEALLRNNGAIIDGAKGFAINDRVICRVRFQTAQVGKQLITDVKVMGHVGGIKKCLYNYVLVRASMNPLPEFNMANIEELSQTEWVSVFDTYTNAPAKIYKENEITGALELIEYPCRWIDLIDFLEFAEFQGVDLFIYAPQGMSHYADSI